MKSYTNSDFKEVRKIDDHTVEIETNAPHSPSCPDVISLVIHHEQEVV